MANNIIKRTWNQNKMVCIEDLTGMAFQSESGGHTFEIYGTNDSGTAVSLSGTVEARFLRADNVKVTIAGTISSGKASVTLTSNCYTVAGRFSLTIFVTSNSQKVAVYSAVGNVVVTDGVSSGTVPPLVTDSIQTGSITASGDVTIGGVLDLTQRRCSATLSKNAWYRVLTYSGSALGALGAGGSIIHLDIVRNYANANNEVHSITLNSVYNNVSFDYENSRSNVFGIDKIRYVHDGNYAYVDIHYALSVSNTVSVCFDVSAPPAGQANYTANSLEEVADSPSGTIDTIYFFAGNTLMDVSGSFSLNATAYSGLNGRVYALYNANNKTVELNCSFNSPNTVIAGGSSSVFVTCSDSKYAPKTERYYPFTYVNTSGDTYFGQYLYITATGSVYQNDSNILRRGSFHVTYEVN